MNGSFVLILNIFVYTFFLSFKNAYFKLLIIICKGLENTSLALVTAPQGLSCPDKSASCSAAALSFPCDITIA